MLIAIPSNNPGGLLAERSDHFGHCDLFTLVEMGTNHDIKGVTILANGDHQAGGCLVPVQLLHAAKVSAIVVGGMGARPLQGFTEVGITVYFADRNSFKTVGAAVDGFKEGALPVMHNDQVCKGSGNCHH